MNFSEFLRDFWNSIFCLEFQFDEGKIFESRQSGISGQHVNPNGYEAMQSLNLLRLLLSWSNDKIWIANLLFQYFNVRIDYFCKWNVLHFSFVVF